MNSNSSCETVGEDDANVFVERCDDKHEHESNDNNVMSKIIVMGHETKWQLLLLTSYIIGKVIFLL